MIHKLRRKFIAIAMVSVTLVMLVMGISINAINLISANRTLNSTLEMIYENQGIVPQFPGGSVPGVPKGDRFTMETPYSTRYFVLRYRENGALISADMRNIAAVTEEDAGAYLAIAQKHGEGYDFTGDYKFYVVKDDGDRYVAIFLDCHDELYTLKTFAAVSLLVVVGCVALVFVLVLLLSKRAITPMLKNMEKQKQFITDASHELKTPITVINTSLKVLEMDTGENKWINKIQGQTDKMTKLVNDMVVLSRLDEEQPPLLMSDFDVSEAVRDAADSFCDFAAAQNCRLMTDIAPGLVYRGDEYAVRQLVSILLDNAVKYSDADGQIRLSLKQEKKGVVLRTENPCASLDGGEPEKLFDRFYRADKSRSGQTAGFGIGLSIARSIAEAHRGSIEAFCPEPGIIRFTIHLR